MKFEKFNSVMTIMVITELNSSYFISYNVIYTIIKIRRKRKNVVFPVPRAKKLGRGGGKTFFYLFFLSTKVFSNQLNESVNLNLI